MSTPVEKIQCPAVPDLPTSSWTNAWRIGHEVVVSGATAHPATREAATRGEPLGAYDQALVVLGKLEALVKAAGGHRHNIVKTVVYVTDIGDKDEVGRARKEFFGGHYPCSTLVAVSGLVFPELRVEIDAWVRLDVDLRQATVLAG
ncbi:RidA family protein [Ramlibacter sp. AW1]|uniref:RidA family protein n=1 Tax=Ramlibacter aurantiacus TaxID=2801330 RepID=A0A936ZGS7_9BURK|nr:Rid family hydrolase [Ramlibacter aurantiacus]MBL0420642.1 RidA family protein [Ramlibacter aurantiacus]